MYDDPWLFAHTLQVALESNFANQAYSVVAATDGTGTLIGKACVVKNSDGNQFNEFTKKNDGNTKTLRFYVLRMR
jgi:hypothetical protein